MERLPGHPLGAVRLFRGFRPLSSGALCAGFMRCPQPPYVRRGLLSGSRGHRLRLRPSRSGSLSLPTCRRASMPSMSAGAINAALSWLARPDALPEPRLATLGIADLNPANVMWDGTTCRLIDFEDGGLSDPAYELADHVEHIAGRLSGVVDGEALVAAVGLSPEERERMRAYRPLWAAFWLVMLLPGNPGFHRNPRGTTEMQATHLMSLLR